MRARRGRVRSQDLTGFVLGVRRVAIVVVLLLGYAYYRAAGDAALAAIGLLSFAAIAQIAPAFLGGLIWSRGTALGASAGLVVGFVTWVYTLLAAEPRLARACSGRTFVDRRTSSASRRSSRRPCSAPSMPQLTHGVVWSLALNLLAYVAFSLWRPATALERMQANAFVGEPDLSIAPSFRLFRASVTVDELKRNGRALSRRGTHEPLLRGLRA